MKALDVKDVIESAKKKLISTIIEKLPYRKEPALEICESSLGDRINIFYIKEVYIDGEGDVMIKAVEDDGEEFEDSLDTFDINTISEVCEWILK